MYPGIPSRWEDGKPGCFDTIGLNTWQTINITEATCETEPLRTNFGKAIVYHFHFKLSWPDTRNVVVLICSKVNDWLSTIWKFLKRFCKMCHPLHSGLMSLHDIHGQSYFQEG